MNSCRFNSSGCQPNAPSGRLGVGIQIERDPVGTRGTRNGRAPGMKLDGAAVDPRRRALNPGVWPGGSTNPARWHAEFLSSRRRLRGLSRFWTTRHRPELQLLGPDHSPMIPAKAQRFARLPGRLTAQRSGHTVQLHEKGRCFPYAGTAFLRSISISYRTILPG